MKVIIEILEEILAVALEDSSDSVILAVIKILFIVIALAVLILVLYKLIIA